MRSSLILGVTLLLTIASTSIVQARTIKSEHTCGSLGPGINGCKCGEIVVKAAKVQKPLVYASPEAINEAALARETAARLSVGTGSYSNAISGCKPHSSGIIDTSSSSSSSSRYSTSSSSASSSVGYLGGVIGRSYSPLNHILDNVSSGSGCGCGKKSEPLEASDLLSSNTDKQIVPSFPPIGDLCYPNKVENSKLQLTTKVTPAYPSKITCSSPTAEKICVNVYNGQIDAGDFKKLSLTTASSSANAASGLLGKLSGASTFANANSLGQYTSSHAGSTAQYGNYGGYSSSNSAGYSTLGSLGGYSSSSSVGYGSSGNVGGYGLAGYSAYGSGYAGYDGYAGYAGYAGSQAGTTGQLNSQISSYGTYGNKLGTLNDVEVTRGSAGSFNCDFGDYSELPQDYSYPQLPADPVSLTLAYRNLFPRIIADKKKVFVSEDKLAFGHRTIPTETVSDKKRLDVPEERLQTLDKPVVELKPISPITITTYNEQEEAKLAELEAIERERIHQEDIATEQRQGNFITYGDLGYAPVNAVLTNKWSQSTDSINALAAEDNVEGCASVGPPTPDYVPGSVIINREIVKNEGQEDDIHKNIESVYVRHYEDERSFEEDDAEDSTSGIFARLSSSKKYGLPCGVA